MASTFSPSLRVELIGDGDQSGIWGQTTNTNLGTLIEQAIAGVVTITMVDTNYTMTNFNGVSDEARNQVIVLTGTNTAQRNLIAPLVEKTYTVKNTTTGGFAVQIIGSSGTGVVIPNGVTTTVYCDGLNFLPASTGAAGNFTVNGNLAVTGTTALTGALSASTATFSGAISSVSPTFTGTPLSTTAAPGTNTTQIATTAFTTAAVTAATGSLGTMSTQNANNVAITGGTINGVTGTNAGLTVGNATNATNATTATNASQFQGKTQLGLGITGETWYDVAGSRGFNSTYTNSRTYPIQVNLSINLPAGGGYDIVCNGVAVGRDANRADVRTNCSFIVPAGGTYAVNGSGTIFYWAELY
jgi:hypothetical protein